MPVAAPSSKWINRGKPAVGLEASKALSTHVRVYYHLNVLEAYLEAPDRGVRFAALYVLAILGQNDISESASPDEAAAYLDVRPDGHAKGNWADQIRRRADHALIHLTEPLERAAWLRALSQLGTRDHVSLQLEQASSCSALEQYVIVWSCAVAELKKAPELTGPFATLIADLVDRREELGEIAESGVWPWEDEFEPDLLQLFARLSEPALEDVAEACARLVAEARGLVSSFDVVLSLILGDPPPRIPDEPCSLSPGRREIAKAFLARPSRQDPWWFWHSKNGNAAAACAQLGVPHDRVVWLKGMGLPQDGSAWLKWLRLPNG